MRKLISIFFLPLLLSLSLSIPAAFAQNKDIMNDPIIKQDKMQTQIDKALFQKDMRMVWKDLLKVQKDTDKLRLDMLKARKAMILSQKKKAAEKTKQQKAVPAT